MMATPFLIQQIPSNAKFVDQYNLVEAYPTGSKNGDGVVNILDLILIANSLGTSVGDVNEDGETNILDLTLVAQQFSQ